MTDAAVLAAALLSTIVSYLDPAVDAPQFWLCIGALLGILTFAAVAMIIVAIDERSRLPGER